MTQFKYCFKDVCRHKFFYLIIFVQLLVTLMILGSAITQITDLFKGINKLNDLAEKKSYVLVDSTSDAQLDKLYANEEYAIKKMTRLFKKIDSFDNVYIHWKYNQLFEKGREGLVITANKNFIDLFNIKTIRGHTFRSEDYKYDGKNVPVIIGYDLNDIYKLGETYSISDGTNKYNVIVVGILKKNSCYLNMKSFSEESLDNAVVFPFSKERLNKSDCLSDYDMALNSMIILSKDKNQVKNFVEEIQTSNTFYTTYEKLSESIDSLVAYLRPQIEYELQISFIILLFSVIAILSNIIIIINNNMTEFAIHIYCGARMKDIFLRVYIQNAFFMFCVLIPIIIIYTLKTALIILLFEMFLMLLLAPFIICNLKKKEITSVLRGL